MDRAFEAYADRAEAIVKHLKAAGLEIDDYTRHVVAPKSISSRWFSPEYVTVEYFVDRLFVGANGLPRLVVLNRYHLDVFQYDRCVVRENYAGGRLKTYSRLELHGIDADEPFTVELGDRILRSLIAERDQAA